MRKIQTASAKQFQKIILAVGALFILGIVAALSYYQGTQQTQTPPETHQLIPYTSLSASPSSGGIVCTMEAKLCPDGSSVGRSGPNCEFAACPNQNTQAQDPIWKKYTNTTYGYSFNYPANYVLTSFPTQNYQQYGLFNNKAESNACTALGSSAHLGDGSKEEACFLAYYYLQVESFTNKEWPTHQSQIFEAQKYLDKSNREWILSTSEIEGLYNVTGYLKNGNSWNSVELIAPLWKKKYPDFLKDADQLAREVFDSFQPKTSL